MSDNNEKKNLSDPSSEKADASSSSVAPRDAMPSLESEEPISAPKLQKLLNIRTPSTLSKLMDVVGTEVAVRNFAKWLRMDPENADLSNDALEAAAEDHVTGETRAYKETVFNVLRFFSESQIKAFFRM